MSKTPILISIAAVAALSVAVAAFISHEQDRSAAEVRFDAGKGPTQVFLPVLPRKEERIVRRLQADGGAIDEVQMRDGTTRLNVFDGRMVLRKVSAFYKGASDSEPGPLMYEKTNTETGHLASERHLRQDGSLEMEGVFNPDTSYTRRRYYPGNSADPAKLVMATEQVYDKWWHPTSQTDYRFDGTKQLVHTWGDGLDENFNYFADDGKTLTNVVLQKRGSYYTAFYYPDGENIRVEGLNTYQGSTFQWYHPDRTLKMKVTYNNSMSDEIIVADERGKLLYKQVWIRDYNGTAPVNGVWPKRLIRLDYYNDEGAIFVRYEYASLNRGLRTVTFYDGDKEYGKRRIYTIGDDGVTATSVKTFDDSNKGDDGKPAVGALAKSFPVPSVHIKYPDYVLPQMKTGLNLYGQQYMYGGH